jgi:hypothetical protein
LTFDLAAPALVQILANGSLNTTNGTSQISYRYVINGAGRGDASLGQTIQSGNYIYNPYATWTLAHFERLEAGTHTIVVQSRNAAPAVASGTICGRNGQVVPYADCTLNIVAYPQNQ